MSTVRASYRFARIPEWVLLHDKLDAVDIRVFGVLDRFDGADCIPALGTIAEKIGKSEDTVRRALVRLANVGAIVIEERFADGRQTSNRYHLAGDSPLQSSPRTDATPGGSTDATLPPGTGATRSRARKNESKKNTPSSCDDDGAVAQSIARGYWDWVKEKTKKPPVGIGFVALRKIIEPFIGAGYLPGDVKHALVAMYEHGRPITRQVLEQHLDGRARRERPPRPAPGERAPVAAPASFALWRDDTPDASVNA